MKLVIAFRVLFLSIISAQVSASIITIDFNDPTKIGSYYLDGQIAYSSDELNLGTTGAWGALIISSPPSNYQGGPNNGTPYLQSSMFSSVFIETTGNMTFDFLNFDLGEYSQYNPTSQVTLTGQRKTGEILQTILTLDGIFDGIGGVNDFQNITLGSNWTDLTSVSFSSEAYSLDNLVMDVKSTVQEVPEPQSLVLFSLGLFGMRLLRKKQK